MGDTARRDELLKKSWEGEVGGEAFFGALRDVLPGERTAWDALTRLEATTRRLIEPRARGHGIEIDEETSARAGASFAEAATTAEARVSLLHATVGVANEFLGIYRELGGLLEPDEVWLSDELVAHELALQHCINALLSGDEDGEKLIDEYLARHGAGA